MAVMSLHTGLLIIILTSFQIGQHGAVRINISPDTFTDLTEDSVSITCLPNTEVTKSKKIFLIEISKDHGNPMVFIRHGDTIAQNNENETRFVADGHIDKDISKSYLNLTLMTPKQGDEGVYTCTILSVDEAGLIRDGRSSIKLTHENLNLTREDTVLLQKIAKLEEQNSILLNRMSTLEKTTIHAVANLNDKVDNRPAFVASTNGSFTVKYRAVLVFPNVFINKGNGYNSQTGIFTAPIAGIYSFSVIFGEPKAKRNFSLLLVVNERAVIEQAVLFQNDDKSKKCTFATMEVPLNQHDQVRLLLFSLRTHQEELFGKYIFSGYLAYPYDNKNLMKLYDFHNYYDFSHSSDDDDSE